jgi:PAS domain S-box-containing protein
LPGTCWDHVLVNRFISIWIRILPHDKNMPDENLRSPSNGRENVCRAELPEGELSSAVRSARGGRQDLRRNENLLQLQIDRMPIASIVWDPQFRVTSWNPAAEKIFGFTAAEMHGKRPHGLILPENVSPQIDQLWSRLLNGDDTAHSVNENLTKDGRAILCEWSNTPLLAPDGSPIGVLSMAQDITKRIRAEQALAASEARFRNLYDSVPIALYQKTPEGHLLEANQALVELLGYPDRGALMAQNVNDLFEEPEDRVREKELLEGEGVVHGFQYPLRCYDGRRIWVKDICRVVKNEEGEVLCYEGSLEDITEKVRFEKVQSVIYTISQATVSTRSVDELYRSIHENLGELMPLQNFYISLYDPARDLISFPYFVDQYDLPGPPVKAGRGLTEYVLRTGRPLLASPQVFQQLVQQGEIELVGTDSVDWLGVPLKTEERVIGVMVAQSYTEEVRYNQKDVDLFEFVSTQIAMAIERKRAEEQIHRDAFHAQALVEVSRQIAGAGLDSPGILNAVAGSVSSLTGEACGIRLEAGGGEPAPLGILYPPESEIADGIDALLSSGSLPVGDGFFCEFNPDGEPVVLEKEPPAGAGSPLPAGIGAQLAQKGIKGLMIVPFQAHGKRTGVLVTARSESEEAYESEDLVFLQEIASRTGLAIANAQLFREVQRSLSKVEALRQIDIAITGSVDQRISLGIVLDQAISQLGVDAANALVLNPFTLSLDTITGRGFFTNTLKNTHLRLGEGYAGKAALERHSIYIPELQANESDLSRSPAFDQEGFVTYVAVPLIAQSRVKGVLEIFHRSPLDPGPEWWDFLEALAGQAAIAIDNASLFQELQQSNQELKLAYDATIEGWSSALDLRDRETEGHTQRVTELTLRMAREFGMSSEELVHVRRGALLHDIGKMGIPDQILRKPGVLTEEEMGEIRKHPTYAYNLLSPIAYLRPALDIPHCHHEKWDGTGYPRRLKGEDIPLVARIFAVADVWDALRSDRPYREAWSEEEALFYIREQSGKHFDPRVVEMFLRVRPWNQLDPFSLERSEDPGLIHIPINTRARTK